MARKRQFKMTPVPAEICASGGYTAQFVDQEEAKDALEFMPAILRNAGIRLDQAIFAKFCRRVFEKMVEHTARTGEWATWTKVMTSRLYILGRFEAPDATVPTENIELVVIPLEGFRLDLSGWTLQNVNAGNTLELKTISDKGGADMGTVTGAKPIEIHGVNCPVDASKEDEGVWLSAKAKSGEEIVEQKLTVVSSDVKTIVVASPGELLAPFAKATFTVRSRAGNPEGLPQEKEISATVKYVAPQPIYESDLGGIKVFAAKDSQGDELPDDELNVPDTDAQLILEGEGLVATDPEHPTTGINKVYFKSSDSAETCESSLTPLGDGKLALSLGMYSAVLEDGSYPNAKYIFFCYTDGESDSLEIPFALHKGE